MLRINKNLYINPAFIVSVEIQDEAVVIETTTQGHVVERDFNAEVELGGLLNGGRGYQRAVITTVAEQEFADLVEQLAFIARPIFPLPKKGNYDDKTSDTPWDR